MIRAIVNCAIGGHYPGLQKSVLARCQTHCGDARLAFYREYPAGCPTHTEAQYAFKIFALREAIAAGADCVLWMDCTFRPRASIEPLWQHIEQHGWYVPRQGESRLATWATDAALVTYGITRETAREIQLVLSGLVGLNLRHEIGAAIWAGWQRMYEAGAFNGPHRHLHSEPFTAWGSKFTGHCSDAPGVEGHRHDEAALSFVLWEMGLRPEYVGFTTIESPDGFIERNL